MPATQTFATVTDWGQQRLNPQSPLLLSSLPNPLALDLLQVFGEGGDVLLRVTSLGVVQLAPTSSTSQCLFGRYYSIGLVPPLTVAAIFLDVFSQNNARQDIMQVRGQGGAPVYHIDYLGVAYFS